MFKICVEDSYFEIFTRFFEPGVYLKRDFLDIVNRFMLLRPPLIPGEFFLGLLLFSSSSSSELLFSLLNFSIYIIGKLSPYLLPRFPFPLDLFNVYFYLFNFFS